MDRAADVHEYSLDVQVDFEKVNQSPKARRVHMKSVSRFHRQGRCTSSGSGHGIDRIPLYARLPCVVSAARIKVVRVPEKIVLGSRQPCAKGSPDLTGCSLENRPTTRFGETRASRQFWRSTGPAPRLPTELL